ncbi:MAG TPA: hypothetical protein VM166_04410 [Gemmatimonadaceae bacterium]|nr:hypothetical protein [Gemmatimonadaceae bacterium]
MTHDVIKHLLDDYVTGDLPEDARAPVAEHVTSCAICSEEVKSLKRVIARARELPTAIEPPAGSWQNIRSAIERDRLATSITAPRRRALWERPMTIAAAALVAAILSAGGTYIYLKQTSPLGDPTLRAMAIGETPATLAAFTIEENNYLRTASMLQDLLDRQQSVLSPETVAQLKASLRTIDEAILEARNALARDPANKMLVEMLSASYRQKVDLLRRSTEMTRGS